MTLPKEHSAGFILFHNKDGKRHYLILHYAGGHFDFPKGHIEEGETKYEAALRELMEETNIEKVEIIDGFEDKIEYNVEKKEGIAPKDVTFFLAKTDQEKIQLSHEHQGSVWLPYEEAYEKITFDNAKNLLKKAEQYLINNP
jgi:bis(5'-nucleosidyl)-tetraphosphatase